MLILRQVRLFIIAGCTSILLIVRIEFVVLFAFNLE